MRKMIYIIFVFLSAVILLYFPVMSFAGQYDLKEMTPEVQAALDNRRDRFEEFRRFKNQEIIGENNRGYVEVLVNDKGAESLADAENRDRRVIYTTVEKQNNLTNALETIEKVFAQVQREKAQSGDKIQTEDGQWVTK